MKRIFARPHNGQTDEENPYWISFSDIMSGLLVIFVMASLALILELTQTRAEVSDAIRELARAEAARREIVREVEVELKKKGINVEVSDNETVLRIPDTLLAFNSNQYNIPQQKRIAKAVMEIGKVLYAAIVHEERWKLLDTIFVEGHTDSRGSARVMGNWGLSTFRAISVWNFWNSNLSEDSRLSKLVNHSGEPLFSMSGYGETRPITDSQVTEEEFRRNRRIDIRFTVRKPSIEKFENIRNLMGKEK